MQYCTVYALCSTSGPYVVLTVRRAIRPGGSSTSSNTRWYIAVLITVRLAARPCGILLRQPLTRSVAVFTVRWVIKTRWSVVVLTVRRALRPSGLL